MILCCDLPRGKFPYVVLNLVVFGHRVSSCVTQATLETRVCHSRVYFNSHPTPLLFVLSFALDVLSRSLPFPSSTTYPVPSHVDAIAPSYQETHNRLFTRCVSLSSLSLQVDRWRAGMLVPPSSCLNFTPFVFPVSGVRLGLYAPLTFFFQHLFFIVLFSVNCTQDWLSRYSIASTVLLSIHTLLGSSC